MRYQDLVRVAAFVVGSSASALKPRIITNDCGSAIASISTAQVDCSSNVVLYTVVTVTITPSALTVTATTDFQATAVATVVEIDTESTTETSDILSTEIDLVYTTEFATSTQVTTLTVLVPFTPSAITGTVTATVTIEPTSTITSYYPTAPAAKKRELEPSSSVEEDEVCEIWVEEVWVDDFPGPTISSMSSIASFSPSSISSIASTSPTSFTSLPSLISSTVSVSSTSFPSLTSSTSSIPTYASACTSWTDYVTACSSVGVSQVTSTVSLTLDANTVTVFVSSTLTSTQIETSSTEVLLDFTTFETIVASTSQTSTATLPIEVESTQTIYSTETLAASTVYTTQTLTVTGTTPALATVSSAIGAFKLAMVPVAGGATLYMTVAQGDAKTYTGAATLSLGSTFIIDSLNRLVTTSTIPEVACVFESLESYYIEGILSTDLAQYASSATPLNCIIASDLTLTCPYKSGASFTYSNYFLHSIAGYNGYPTYIAHVIPV